MTVSRPSRYLLYFLFSICPLLFFIDLTRNPYYTQIALLNIVVPACWFVWLMEAWKSGELVWVRSPFDLPLLALLGISFLSWPLSMAAHRHLITPIYSEGSKAIIFLLVNTFMIYSAALRAREYSLFRRLLWITYAVTFVASLYGI